MPSPKAKQFLVISALGQDRPGIVNALSGHVTEVGCNIVDSRMTVLGGEFAVLMLVEGPWGAVAKLEHGLAALQRKLDLTIIARRTTERSTDENLMPYTADVVTLDHPGLVQSLAEFFSSRNINIQDLRTGNYRAAHTGSPMFSATITVGIPSTLSIATLREEFLDYCEQLNVDGVLEPTK